VAHGQPASWPLSGEQPSTCSDVLVEFDEQFVRLAITDALTDVGLRPPSPAW
jgi:hypothetical protein